MRGRFALLVGSRGHDLSPLLLVRACSPDRMRYLYIF